MDKYEWFRKAKFGMMVHWGLYSLPAGEWQGKRMGYIGEWIQSRYRIPNNEYHKLARAFNPVCFNADEWVQLAQDAGMKYMVVTAKHHEGFALFKSDVSPFNVVDATPFGRDIIGELADACARKGMKLGLYYSQDLDWSDPDGGGYTAPRDNHGPNDTPDDYMSWTNDWDFPDASKKNYTRCYEQKIKPQVHELLTRYGELCLIWFDTPRTISPQQSRELVDMVHRYQPGCLVNSRVGNGMGDYTSMGDNEIPDDFKSGGLFETPATLNDTWGYKAFDDNWKSPERVTELRNYLNARGINYLLNVGPDHLGRIPAPAVDILQRVGKQHAFD